MHPDKVHVSFVVVYYRKYNCTTSEYPSISIELVRKYVHIFSKLIIKTLLLPTSIYSWIVN